ncbi:MAG: hypothetical protein GY745_01650 [Actinomycetia bacterium]|nr:hypothetical protein [Actinomycetes bacterium]
MTIRRGEEWGTAGPLGPDGVVVTSDSEANEIITAARRDRTDPPELGLLGGDLCRTVGGRGDRDRLATDAAQRLPIDLGVALLDGGVKVFVAHLVVPARAWLGPWTVVMNAGWLGEWQFAPASHPNDGRLDVLEGSVPLKDLATFRLRARAGAHIPHPGITTRRTEAVQFEFDRPRPVVVDGRPAGRARTISIRVEPDRLLCVV